MTRLQREIDEYNMREGKLNDEDGIDCPKCKNKGYIAFDNEGYLYVKPCHCLTLRRSIKMLEKCGISREILYKYTFDTFIDEKPWQKDAKKRALDYVKANLESPGKWLFFGGQSGSGKTHLCTAIIQELSKKYGVKYEMWIRLAERLKFMDDKERKEETINELIKVDVLYLDDLLKGNAAPSDADIRLLFEIINGRYLGSKKITIISSELTLKELMSIDEAIAGRIAERIGTGLQYVFTIPKDAKMNYRVR